jgi:hypothetical protein
LQAVSPQPFQAREFDGILDGMGDGVSGEFHAYERGSAQDRAIIDLMLAHTPRSGVEHLYNRYAYMNRRREIA